MLPLNLCRSFRRCERSCISSRDVPALRPAWKYSQDRILLQQLAWAQPALAPKKKDTLAILDNSFQPIRRSSEEETNDFNSLRGTTASRNPCSSRNSER